jgi:hypothetical protein
VTCDSRNSGSNASKLTRARFHPLQFNPPTSPIHIQNDCRLEGRWPHVRILGSRISNLPLTPIPSYNRYLAIAARTVRRSLKETPRLNSERRGQMDLRFAKWEVS